MVKGSILLEIKICFLNKNLCLIIEFKHVTIVSVYKLVFSLH